MLFIALAAPRGGKPIFGSSPADNLLVPIVGALDKGEGNTGTDETEPIGDDPEEIEEVDGEPAIAERCQALKSSREPSSARN
jgi:hypothetical protein